MLQLELAPHDTALASFDELEEVGDLGNFEISFLLELRKGLCGIELGAVEGAVGFGESFSRFFGKV